MRNLVLLLGVLVIMKKYGALLVLALIVVVAIFSFFSRMYRNDMRSLEEFLASYKTFDAAISDFTSSKTDALGSVANNALITLTAKATFRLSSLIKNEKETMNLALEIADLAGKELKSLQDYKEAIQNKDADVDTLAKAYDDLSSKRKAAFARFEELGGI